MAAELTLKVITPERTVVDAVVESVTVRTPDGEMGILPQHIPLVSALEVHVLSFKKAGQKESVAVMGGLLRTNGRQVSVLTDAAELASEVDAMRAKEAKERAEARLRQASSDVDMERAKYALARSLTRLKLKH